MSRHVLVTGGLGVIGSLYVRRLLAGGDDVTIIDPGQDPRHHWTEKLLNEFSDAARGNAREIYGTPLQDWGRPQLAHLLSGCDAVLHAGAHTGIPHSELDPNDDWESNVDATRNLLEAMRSLEKPVPTVVLSSVKPYRVWDEYAVDEDEPLEPDEPYAASKAAQSMLCMAYGRTYGMPVVCFRCSNLYGPAPCHGPRHGWLTWFCIQAALGLPITIEGDGKQRRDMLHADDVASAVELAFAKVTTLGGEVFNLGGGGKNAIGVGEAASLALALGGDKAGVKTGRARPRDDKFFITDHGRFTFVAGWEPKVDVRDGIAQVVRWAQLHADELRKVYAEWIEFSEGKG